jgi:hypothetical protein
VSQKSLGQATWNGQETFALTAETLIMFSLLTVARNKVPNKDYTKALVTNDELPVTMVSSAWTNFAKLF